MGSRTFRAGGSACLLVMAIGCGGPAVYPVQGQVVYRDGKPVTKTQIEVERVADEPRDRVNYSAALDDSGRFSLPMREGNYQALLVPVQEALGTVEGSGFTPPFPRRYMAYSGSELKFAVTKDADKNVVKFEIERP